MHDGHHAENHDAYTSSVIDQQRRCPLTAASIVIYVGCLAHAYHMIEIYETGVVETQSSLPAGISIKSIKTSLVPKKSNQIFYFLCGCCVSSW